MREINFNKNWYFKFGNNVGDEAKKRTNYNLIGLPHSFGIPYYGENDFYVGYGCYYKKFSINYNRYDTICLEFGAVFQVAEIFINGNYVFKHEGGYTAFCVDITKYVKQGENDVFIRVNNLWSETIAPRAGEHVFNGGIYRDVKLLVFPSSYINWCGVKTTITKVKENTYNLNIKTSVSNAIGKTLITTIMDENDEVISTIEDIVDGGEVVQNIQLYYPKLWSTDNPCLYTVRSVLDQDRIDTKFGVRVIEWSVNDGFYLNDRHILLEGANVHQDRGGWADASTHTAIHRDIALMKGCGFNFIRGSHYPHHTEFAKECDRQGMLFWSEAPFWGIGGFSTDGYWNSSAMPVRQKDFAPFEKNLKQQIKEMIDANYNSPSIICWSLGNEMFFSKKEVLEDMKALLIRLCDYVHELDSTRPVAIGGCQRGGLDKFCDVAGYNGDGAIIFKNPDVPNMLTGYGSFAAYRPGKVDLYETRDSENLYHWRAGRAIWCGFHHGSIAGIGNLGICDLYRLPLNAYYAYRNKNLGLPIPKQAIRDNVKRLELTVDKNYLKGDGTDDVMLTCTMYGSHNERVSYDGEVEIEVISGPLILPTGKKMTFHSSLKNCFDGVCAIEARGYYSGKSLVVAKMEDLTSNMVVIDVVSNEDYYNDIVYEVAEKTPVRQSSTSVDIIENKPVMVSSESLVGSSIALTDPLVKKYWSPDKNDSQPYLILDMQKYYYRYNVQVKTKLFSSIIMKIFTSTNSRDWEEIGITDKHSITITNRARYIKIMVNKKAKIKNIKIYERQV